MSRGLFYKQEIIKNFQLSMSISDKFTYNNIAGNEIVKDV